MIFLLVRGEEAIEELIPYGYMYVYSRIHPYVDAQVIFSEA